MEIRRKSARRVYAMKRTFWRQIGIEKKGSRRASRVAICMCLIKGL